MRKTREEKAITLIALIITIVVLLILAVVAINAVTGDGIIQHATNAKTEYEKAQEEENSLLLAYEEYLTTQTGWKQNRTVVSKNEMILNVGDYIDYKSSDTDTMKWRVLGAEKGQILLISESDIATKLLTGKAGYESAINGFEIEWNNYVNTELATEARSVKVGDINKITGYNPEKAEFNKGTIYEYGNIVEYEYDGIIKYNGVDSTCQSFDYYDDEWKSLSSENPRLKVECKNYMYYPTTLTESETGDVIGIKKDSESYEVLFKNTDGSKANYWFVDTCFQTAEGYIGFGVYCVEQELVNCKNVKYSIGLDQGPFEKGLRAVVYLKSEINLNKEKTENGVTYWNIENS